MDWENIIAVYFSIATVYGAVFLPIDIIREAWKRAKRRR